MYVPKMYGLGDQVGYSPEVMLKLERVELFTCLLYTEYWMNTSKAAEAALQDLNLFKNLFIYKQFDPELAEVVLTVLSRHTWYLSEELIALAMCSKKLSNQSKQELASKMQSFKRPEEYRPGKPVLPEVSEDSQISDFVGANSWLVLDILGLEGDWLNRPVGEWVDSREFMTFSDYVLNLKVVNDTAERGIKLWSEYIGILTSDEVKRQDLVQVVEEHRGKVKARSKAALWEN